jgi:hypothetical protein
MAAPVGKPEPDRPSTEAPRTAVLPLEVAGNIRASRPALERALATGLGGVGAALLPADETARRLAGRPPAARCRDEACWRELGAALGVSRLVGGAVTRSEGQFIVDLQLVDGGSGRTLREKRGRCDEEYCSVADLVRRSAAELASARVADAAPAASPELPPRAPVGGARAETGLVQPPDLRTAPPEPKSAWRTYAPHAVIGAGVAALAVAVIAFRRDGSCIQAGCLYRYTALPEGIALTGAGVALVGTGVYFLLSDGPGAPGPRAAAPALGAGWAGRF